MSELSVSKEDILKRVLLRDWLLDDLDDLLNYRGLWCGLRIANFPRYLALHCDEQISNYLQHIRENWDKATGRIKRLQLAVDPETVGELQYLVLAGIDRAHVKDLMRERKIFKSITDESERHFLLLNL